MAPTEYPEYKFKAQNMQMFRGIISQVNISMANNDSTTNNTESNVLKLQSLQSEFKLFMTQYQQAYANYISSLRSSSDPASKKTFVAIPGSTYWGTIGISDDTSHSTEDCIALCSANSSCTGATYNSDKQHCWVRGGQSDIGPGLDTDSAIVSELKDQNLFDALTSGTQNLSITLKNSASANKIVYEIRGALLSSETYSENLGDNQTVDLTYSVQIGGANDTTAGLFMSGSYQNELDAITSGFFKLGTGKL